MNKVLVLLPIPLFGTMIAAVATNNPILAFAAIMLSWPLILPVAGLGCHKCNYNLFLPYRGANYSEHGDSWTHDDVWRRSQITKKFSLPESCPKCGAEILAPTASSNIAEQN